ncbi:GntR family transcriptional regulator [Listeria booriae]|uniref:GntR family transcriptional regulator n=1 Tax=Listeria booriae TaxID=1552123 RepID=A0A7X0XAF8_9LIST|nr:GntR family transcriptional regulator [Listeria booriae]MBC1490599.1 GntR family transcriptional regulator [Listeria booriae]MBC1503599.1 GntR family transcriptional regulator [Listeria booriae]MBC1524881.1 GntR family transcriptional regulator [Listeria booriae]MBC1530523.1 GntR family transcriptional regulator [Listeria booriae]MBC6134235.1 GntR family transcriptional regulator [Listeria booriae]
MKSKREYKTLDRMVYFSIIEKIKTGELKPNEHLTEERLSKELNVSRSPIRKAITALVSEGILDYRTYSGVVVRDSMIDAAKYAQLLEVIEVFIDATIQKMKKDQVDVDIDALRNYISSMDRSSYLQNMEDYIFNQHQFFFRILKHDPNPFYYENVKRVFFTINNFSMETVVKQGSEDRRDQTVKKFTKIADAFEQKDYDLANQRIRDMFGEFALSAFR